MMIFNHQTVPAETEAEGAKGVRVRWLITEKTGAPNFAMRLFEVEPGGYSPLHDHPWEHEVYILEGEGTIKSKEDSFPVRAGDVIFITPKEKHQLNNDGGETLKFLCMIPKIPEKDR